MPKAKVSKIGFLRENPEATYEEFYNATGGTRQNYHSNKWLISKGRKKKPAKAKTVRVKAHRRHPANTAPEVAAFLSEQRVNTLVKENQELRHQIVGFRAVISYLEDLAGIRISQ